MTKANYIDWENLKNIPFFLCQVVEDEQNQEIVLYYFGERVFHDYDHVGHYMRSAIVLFRQIRNRTADWGELPTPKGMSFGENSPLFFPASFCHCFLGHEVVHPQEGSPQA